MSTKPNPKKLKGDGSKAKQQPQQQLQQTPTIFKPTKISLVGKDLNFQFSPTQTSSSSASKKKRKALEAPPSSTAKNGERTEDDSEQDGLRRQEEESLIGTPCRDGRDNPFPAVINATSVATADGRLITLRKLSESETMLATKKLPSRLNGDDIDDWEREHIVACLNTPFREWQMAHVSTVTRLCPKLFFYVESKAKEETGLKQGDIENSSHEKNNAQSSFSTMRMIQVKSTPQFPQGNFTKAQLQTFVDEVIASERDGVMFDRRHQLFPADRVAIKSLMETSGAAIDQQIREHWEDNGRIPTSVWLAALQSAVYGVTSFSSSPLENWQREEATSPLRLDMINPTQTTFNISRMVTRRIGLR